jgi:hypothetical protein
MLHHQHFLHGYNGVSGVNILDGLPDSCVLPVFLQLFLVPVPPITLIIFPFQRLHLPSSIIFPWPYCFINTIQLQNTYVSTVPAFGTGFRQLQRTQKKFFLQKIRFLLFLLFHPYFSTLPAFFQKTAKNPETVDL